MKQIVQSLKTGKTEILNVPCPEKRPGHLLIRSACSLISAGTERMLLEFGKAGWIEKARLQPEKLKQVVDKIRTDGFAPTFDAVKSKLDQPLPLGYCNVGEVLEVGEGVVGFSKGDRVVSNGGHAEVVSVAKNLCAKIPENVSNEEAVFTIVSSIGLQGIRLAKPTLGETAVVIGLGLVGLMTVQLLLAQGCKVLGVDYDAERLALAKQFGAEIADLEKGDDPIAAANAFSGGRGIDLVLITASTKSNEPVHQAAVMCRKRGRIILVGVTGLALSRADFYEKELSFQVSCSYGPGRYDANYEEKGQDYPFGFVRWTEQRNFEAVLGLVAGRKLNPTALISHRFSIDNANSAYQLVGGKGDYLGVLIEFPGDSESIHKDRIVELAKPSSIHKDVPAVSFIGAGNYASSMLIPAIKSTGVELNTIVSKNGLSSVHVGKKFGFNKAVTDVESVLLDPLTDILAIATRHDSHAGYVIKALEAGKHVFVEKPLALTLDELAEIENAYNKIRNRKAIFPLLMVGFNRRFAPQVRKIKELLARVKAPKSFVITVNAGLVPEDHWVQDLKVGGGRIIGEACHFVDLLRFLAGSPISSWTKMEMDSSTNDTVSLQLGFENGSIGNINYFSNGNKSFPKERLEVFAAGGILQLDNYRIMSGFGWSGFSKMNLRKQDKGQQVCVAEFIQAAIKGAQSPIPFDQLMEVSRTIIEIAEL